MKARHGTGWALRVLMVAAFASLVPASAAAAHPQAATAHLPGAMALPQAAMAPLGVAAHPPQPPVLDVGSAKNAGPIGPADRDLLVKVRLAGLWEMPAGQLAMTKGTLPRVRQIGAEISAQHGDLDALVLTAAAEVGVPLPSQPNADQLGWLAEMERATGSEFDRVFVERLRAAHGKVFPVIADVRAGTRNDVIRALAQASNDFVLNHLTLLESTGLVDYDLLPLPPEPLPAARTASGGIKSGVDPVIVWLVLAAAVITGASTVLRVTRPR